MDRSGPFFVLSGFLITGILLDTKNAPQYFRSFYMRRLLRIQPLYLVVMTTLVLLLGACPKIFGATIHPVQIAAIYSMCVDCLVRNYEWSVTGITWYLSVEEHFYLIWPLIVRKLSRRSLVEVMTGVIFACLAIRSAAVLTGSKYSFFYFNAICRSDALAVGALLALLFRNPKAWTLWCSNVRFVLGALVAGLGIIWYLQRFQFSSYDKPMATIGYTIVALFWATVLTLAVDANRGENWARHIGRCHWLQICGKYSYAMYLMHEAVHVFLSRHFWTRLPESGLPIFRMGVIPVSETLLTLVLAWGSWELLEKRALHLKYRFTPWSTREDGPDQTAVLPLLVAESA